jgi:hypothetical protein
MMMIMSSSGFLSFIARFRSSSIFFLKQRVLISWKILRCKYAPGLVSRLRHVRFPFWFGRFVHCDDVLWLGLVALGLLLRDLRAEGVSCKDQTGLPDSVVSFSHFSYFPFVSFSHFQIFLEIGYLVIRRGSGGRERQVEMSRRKRPLGASSAKGLRSVGAKPQIGENALR